MGLRFRNPDQAVLVLLPNVHPNCFTSEQTSLECLGFVGSDLVFAAFNRVL